MRRDHRPYFIRRAYLKFQEFYVEHFLRPQFESLGRGCTFVRPWNVVIFGSRISLGDYANVIAAFDAKIRLAVWGDKEDLGRIQIGSYCLICPSVRVSSACEIVVGDSCMLANDVYITDSDWHDAYSRVTIGKTAPVRIEENVWVGDRATICKGVTIGKNSIIGAGAVVSNSIPPNTVAAGNPARIVKSLDPNVRMTTRAHWYEDPSGLFAVIEKEARNMLHGNTLFHWFRSLLFPGKKD